MRTELDFRVAKRSVKRNFCQKVKNLKGMLKIHWRNILFQALLGLPGKLMKRLNN